MNPHPVPDAYIQGLGASDCRRGLARDRQKSKTANCSTAICGWGPSIKYLNWLAYGLYKSSALQSGVKALYGGRWCGSFVASRKFSWRKKPKRGWESGAKGCRKHFRYRNFAVFSSNSHNALPKHKRVHPTPETEFWFHHAGSHTYSSSHSHDTQASRLMKHDHSISFQ
jgi:hypothetical protein